MFQTTNQDMGYQMDMGNLSIFYSRTLLSVDATSSAVRRLKVTEPSLVMKPSLDSPNGPGRPW